MNDYGKQVINGEITLILDCKRNLFIEIDGESQGFFVTNAPKLGFYLTFGTGCQMNGTIKILSVTSI